MNATVEKALAHWGMEGPEYRLVAARENAVFEVSTNNGSVALRLHRKGYRSDTELQSELFWMAEVSRSGISTPAPIATSSGVYLIHIDGVQVDVLTWLSGTPMIDVLDTLHHDVRGSLFFSLGQEMAKLHIVSDAWQPPENFERVHWNKDGLLGPEPLWDRFWENPELPQEEVSLLTKFRDVASAQLAKCGAQIDYGLIHADLVPANVMVDGKILHLIDFDDGGYGYRLFDIATALLKHHTASDYEQLKHSLIAGYQSKRPLDISNLDLFMAIRAVTYLGWNITRLHEENGAIRNKRFLETAKQFVTRYLSNQ